MNVLALCAGVGGLELGLKLAVPAATTVCYVERETYNVAVLVARMADGCLDDAPIWPDATTFDGQPWRGVVDCITAGFPCQPWSVAGQQQKTDNDRWPWPAIARVVREVEPRYVFVENVPGLLHGGLEHVLGDLAGLGFDAAWDVFSAAASGAPHRRQRVFILADGDTDVADADEGGRGAPERNLPRGQPDAPWGREAPDADGEPSYRSAVAWPECRDWAVEPDVGRVADGVAFRVDRLTAIGNGVVPAVAARAWRELSTRLAI